MLRRRYKRRYIAILIDNEMFEARTKLSYNLSSTSLKISNIKNLSDQSEKALATNFLKTIRKTYSELFGTIDLEKSGIGFIEYKNCKLAEIKVIKCYLNSLEKLLFTLAISYPPTTTLKVSGTLKKLTSLVQDIGT